MIILYYIFLSQKFGLFSTYTNFNYALFCSVDYPSTPGCTQRPVEERRGGSNRCQGRRIWANERRGTEPERQSRGEMNCF